ncbi:TraE/TraK family type IV conjugative transfer system protein [Alteromonas macleodii]|uniref:TraE family protein n=1 Tax=Alteromonas macleodii TaxID=28108 RepID=A0AB36FRJ8_ALTMA|nr:TraE/TraK family type IV conjugative transfer system protein [Alteromonas macleodii]OES24213.1 traE family protein [Alteromonas macleodii]OES24844.1 traE family protein [Alteromonas macleodii]OES25122.1 traE family protein [Alteromonas macleodii]OES39164.1 traE family protein [Alteromonas macleodii]
MATADKTPAQERKEKRVNYFLSKNSNLFTENKLLKFGFVALCLMVMYQQISIPRMIESQRTVILPSPSFKYEVGRFGANDAYIFDTALTVLDYYENVNAGNVEQFFSALLLYAAPEFHGELKERLNKRKKIINKLTSISYFTEFMGPNDISKKGDEIYIVYNYYRRIGGRVEPAVRKKLTITHTFQNGRFMITKLEETEV